MPTPPTPPKLPQLKPEPAAPAAPPVENEAARYALERMASTATHRDAIAAHRAARFLAVIQALSAVYNDIAYDPGIVPDESAWLYVRERVLALANLVMSKPKEPGNAS